MLNQSQIVALILVAVSVKLFINHRTRGYKGNYNPDIKYVKTSAVKHDMCKIFTVHMLTLLVFGLNGTKLFDIQSPLNSWFGKTLVTVTGYFVAHELMQPYIVSNIPYF